MDEIKELYNSDIYLDSFDLKKKNCVFIVIYRSLLNEEKCGHISILIDLEGSSIGNRSAKDIKGFEIHMILDSPNSESRNTKWFVKVIEDLPKDPIRNIHFIGRQQRFIFRDIMDFQSFVEDTHKSFILINTLSTTTASRDKTITINHNNGTDSSFSSNNNNTSGEWSQHINSLGFSKYIVDRFNLKWNSSSILFKKGYSYPSVNEILALQTQSYLFENA